VEASLFGVHGADSYEFLTDREEIVAVSGCVRPHARGRPKDMRASPRSHTPRSFHAHGNPHADAMPQRAEPDPRSP
jgi:hypothetical protein